MLDGERRTTLRHSEHMASQSRKEQTAPGSAEVDKTIHLDSRRRYNQLQGMALERCYPLVGS